jgi:N-methylhydantoinase B
VETVFRFDGEETRGVVFGDGVDEDARAFGLFEGKPGSINRIELIYPDGRVHVPKSKEVISSIAKGTVFHEVAGGGGGYGDPRLRPIEKVLDDVLNEVVSVERAREDYGVVVDPETLEVDRAATRRIKRKISP